MRSLHFGSAMIDIITLVASEDIERLTLSNEGASFLMLETGRKLAAESITSHIGGGGCNTAVSLARRGWQSAVLAKVGEDLNAAAVREHLAACGVEDRLVTCDLATGTAVMVASHDRNASIFVHRGANEELSPDDLPNFSGLDLVYIAPLSSGSAACFPEIIHRARGADAKVAANPGIRQLTARTDEFFATLPNIHFLSINRAEADALVPALAQKVVSAESYRPPADPPALVRRGLRSDGYETGLVSFMQGLRSLGPEWLSVTDGADGAYLAGPDGIYWQPTIPATVAGTAGAGDAFCSTMMAALMEGIGPEAALLEAALNAASVVSFVDTTKGLLTSEVIHLKREAASEYQARRI